LATLLRPATALLHDPGTLRRSVPRRPPRAAVREQSRLRLLIDNHYRLYDTRRKETLDALRVAASNMFASLLSVFRPLYDNRRNDRLPPHHDRIRITLHTPRPGV
jgi:hypothetical protein